MIVIGNTAMDTLLKTCGEIDGLNYVNQLVMLVFDTSYSLSSLAVLIKEAVN